MPPVAAPLWWEDVQQEREDFAGRSRRPVDEWLDEEVDFAPRRRPPPQSPAPAPVPALHPARAGAPAVVLGPELGAAAREDAPAVPRHDDAEYDDAQYDDAQYDDDYEG